MPVAETASTFNECVVMAAAIAAAADKDEKLALVQKTIDDGKWNGIPYFQSITAAYMANKPHETEMLSRMDVLWDEIYN